MKLYILTNFFLLAILSGLQAQNLKFEITPNLKENNTKGIIYIHRINTIQFDSIISSNPNSVIHFMQPWCSGVTLWIDKFDSLRSQLEKYNTPLFLIYDTEEEEKYFKMDGKTVGMGAYYILKYQIKIPVYIIGSNESLDVYRKEISRIFKTKVSDKNYCFYIKDHKVKYQSKTYRFYKKIFKIIR